MPSAVDHCNIALSHLGSDTIVTSIDPLDGSIEAAHCARFYPIARRALLEEHHFPFALRRATLAETTNESDVWTYCYSLPSNCLRPLRIIERNLTVFEGVDWLSDIQLQRWDYANRLLNERGSADFEIENGLLFTHVPEAVLVYRTDVTDTSKFTASFDAALGFMLASYIAGPIIKGAEGATAGNRFFERAQAAVTMASASAANGSRDSTTAEFTPSSIRARA